MANGLCDSSACREDLLLKLETKISIKYLLASLAIAVTMIGIIASIGYNAYAGRADKIEVKQEEVNNKINRIDKTVAQIQTKQESIEDLLTEVKDSLKKLNDKVKYENPSKMEKGGNRTYP